MFKFAANIPVNNLSFGQISYVFLRTLFEKHKNEIDLSLFPIGTTALDGYELTEDFGDWLQTSVMNGPIKHDRDTPAFKLWHLSGGLESYSKKQVLLTFYELDAPTEVEENVARQNHTVFTNSYSSSVFKSPTSVIPLAFDDFSFKRIDKKFFHDGRIVFNLCGKVEKRKHHAQAIQAWIKKYGGNKKYSLQCAIYNSFLKPEQNQQVIHNIVKGNKPFNVTFLPYMQENVSYNHFLNSGNIIIGASGGEGWGLPEFHSVAIGKHGVVMNAHGYKEWANADNVTLFEAGNKEEAYDNMFFKKGSRINQGNIFGFNEDAFIAGCEEAVKKVESNPLNENGLTLQSTFSREKFTQNILNTLKGL